MEPAKATTANEVAFFCPECGSAAVEIGELVGSAATCKACSWSGPREKLMGYAFQSDMNGAEALKLMVIDFRKVFGQMAQQLGAFLLKWGFLEVAHNKQGMVVLNPQQLARYLSAMAHASLQSIIKEREKMEIERSVGKRTGS